MKLLNPNVAFFPTPSTDPALPGFVMRPVLVYPDGGGSFDNVENTVGVVVPHRSAHDKYLAENKRV